MRLREMTFNDLDFLLSVRNHESTRRNLENDSVFSIEECRSWFKNLKCTWLIIEVDGLPVGYIRTSANDEVGIDIHMEHRNKGYATKAYLMFLEDKNTAKLWVFEDNFAKKIYEKIGFKCTGLEKFIRGRKYVEMLYEKIPGIFR